MTPAQLANALAAAGAALAKASLCDPRIRKPSDALVAQWAEILGPTITPAEAVAAVVSYYRDPQERVIQPGDIRAWVASNRQLPPLAEHLAETRAIAASPGNERTIDAAKRHIRQLIADRTGTPDVGGIHPQALAIACPWCHSAAGTGCVNLAAGRPSSRTHPARETAACPHCDDQGLHDGRHCDHNPPTELEATA